MNIFLTKSSMPVIGWIADILGYIISGIFWCLEKIGLPNIGLAIILYTFVMYLLMTPLQVKQQKLSKMNSIIMPEVRKIQDKYKNKKDQQSMMRMNEEIQFVYQKYGVSQMGSCVQMLITFPVMLALYQVIYYIPGYISSVKAIFSGLVTKITAIPNVTDILQNFVKDNKITTVQLALENGVVTNNSIIDLLYKLTSKQWTALENIPQFHNFTNVISSTQDSIMDIGKFCGMNISDTPMLMIKDGFSSGQYLLIIGAILIPVLAWFTQWLNYKLMPQMPSSGNGETSAMESSMKSMNTVMPLMSAFFCVTFPIGVGIYWIAGAVFRSIQQLLINRHLNKMDIDELVKKNQEKMEKKREKTGLPPQKITQQATQNVKRINEPEKGDNNVSLKAGSIASKANMVKQFDEKNKKK